VGYEGGLALREVNSARPELLHLNNSASGCQSKEQVFSLSQKCCHTCFRVLCSAMSQHPEL
jgi:hypothetical protein